MKNLLFHVPTIIQHDYEHDSYRRSVPEHQLVRGFFNSLCFHKVHLRHKLKITLQLYFFLITPFRIQKSMMQTITTNFICVANAPNVFLYLWALSCLQNDIFHIPVGKNKACIIKCLVEARRLKFLCRIQR